MKYTREYLQEKLELWQALVDARAPRAKEARGKVAYYRTLIDQIDIMEHKKNKAA